MTDSLFTADDVARMTPADLRAHKAAAKEALIRLYAERLAPIVDARLADVVGAEAERAVRDLLGGEIVGESSWNRKTIAEYARKRLHEVAKRAVDAAVEKLVVEATLKVTS